MKILYNKKVLYNEEFYKMRKVLIIVAFTKNI